MCIFREKLELERADDLNGILTRLNSTTVMKNNSQPKRQRNVREQETMEAADNWGETTTIVGTIETRGFEPGSLLILH